MGIRNFLSGKPQTVHDDYFGKLSFIKAKGVNDSYIEGRFYFKPTSSEIELWIEGDFDALTTRKAFVEGIQQNYESIKVESIKLITNEYRKWMAKFAIVDFDTEFTPVFLSISRKMDNQKQKWEIAYETIHDRNHTITLNFEDWQATGVLIDG